MSCDNSTYLTAVVDLHLLSPAVETGDYAKVVPWIPTSPVLVSTRKGISRRGCATNACRGRAIDLSPKRIAADTAYRPCSARRVGLF
jgi:hypothetical protein